MRTYTGSTAFQRYLAVAVPLVVLAWFVTVPAVFTTSSFLAVAGLLAALGWIAMNTYLNGQPAASLAQVIHDADDAPSLDRPREKR